MTADVLISLVAAVFVEHWYPADNGSGKATQDYGSILLEVVIACAADAVSTRPDLLHAELASLLTSFVKRHGCDASDPSRFGLKPMSLYRCVEVLLRTYFFFSRKKMYVGRMARWAESNGRHRDLESLREVCGRALAA